jgi:hypothetical protein
MMRLSVGIAGVGLIGPGLADWAEGRAALRDSARWVATSTVVPAAARLPATERRRAGPGIKIAVAVADQACAMAGIDAAAAATVFTSASGDPGTCHAICEALATPERLVSPTRFTNSVHNAAAGYWHIATQSMQASTSLGGHDASFADGLLEAAAQCASLRSPVLLVVSDVPFPEPLHALRPLTDSFACAFVLLPQGGRWRLSITAAAGGAATKVDMPGLDAVRCAIPAARALPLLQALARDANATITIDGDPGFALSVQLEPAA